MYTTVFRIALVTASLLAFIGLTQARTTVAPTPQIAESICRLNSEDRDFLDKAAYSNYFEIAGSKLALKQSTDEDVKTFAKTIIDEHKTVSQQLSALAHSKGYEPPAGTSLLKKAKLKMLRRHHSSFDKIYIEKIGVSAHEHDIELFEKASKNASDPAVKQFATETLPRLRQLLEQAHTLQQRIKT